MIRLDDKTSIIKTHNKKNVTKFCKIYLLQKNHLMKRQFSIITCNIQIQEWANQLKLISKKIQISLSLQQKGKSNMSKFRSIVHVFHLNKPVTESSISELAQKFNLYSRLRPAAVGIVVNLPSTSPVMVDSMAQLLKSFRSAHNIPIIGFTHENITLQSYYLLSISDKIYTYPTTIYRLRPDKIHISMSNLYKKLNLKKTLNLSNEKLFTKFLNLFPIPNKSTFQQPSYQDVDIGQRIFKEALKNRKQFWGVSPLKSKYPGLEQQRTEEKTVKNQQGKQDNKKLLQLDYNSLQTVMMGEDAVKHNLVDGYGFYDEILRREFPTSEILKAKYPGQNKSISKIIFMITSPIILILFLIKVVIKWSIIFYAWLKSKAMGMAGIDQEQISNIKQISNSDATIVSESKSKL